MFTFSSSGYTYPEISDEIMFSSKDVNASSEPNKIIGVGIDKIREETREVDELNKELGNVHLSNSEFKTYRMRLICEVCDVIHAAESLMRKIGVTDEELRHYQILVMLKNELRGYYGEGTEAGMRTRDTHKGSERKRQIQDSSVSESSMLGGVRVDRCEES